MASLIIAAGMLARTGLLILFDHQPRDLTRIISIVVISIAVSFVGITDEPPPFFVLPLIPITFVVAAAFAFKDRILREITEGTLLLYGLLALFVYVETAPEPPGVMMLDDPILYLLSAYTLVTLGLCLFRIRFGFKAQVYLFISFIAVNAYLGYTGLQALLLEQPHALGYFLAGFYGLHFVSNVLYIFTLVPFDIKKLDMTYAEKVKRAHEQARALADSYIDIDVGRLRTMSLLILGAALYGYAQYFDDWVTGLALAFIVGHALTAPPKESTFTPGAVLRKR